MGRLTEQSAMQHEQEIQRRREASAREDLAFRKGYNSVQEMEQDERRATHNATVKQNQQRYFSVAQNRARIIGDEPYPDLLPQGLETNPDLSTLEPAQRAYIQTHEADSARQQAEAFKRSEPRYVQSQESSQMIIHVMAVNNLAPVEENFRAAFNLCVANGLIAVREVEAAPAPALQPEPTPVTALVPEITRSENPINPATGTPYTERELDAMDAETYAKVFRLQRGHQYRYVKSDSGFMGLEDLNEVIGRPGDRG